jgi:hypothetical protein
LGSPPEVRRLKWRVAAEHEPVGVILVCLVRDEDVAKCSDDRHRAAAGAALRVDLAVCLLVIRALDADDAAREVHVCPAERHQLSAAKTCVEGRRPDRPIARGKSRKKTLGLLRRSDPFAAAADRGQPEMRAWVHRYVAVFDRPAEDHS